MSKRMEMALTPSCDRFLWLRSPLAFLIVSCLMMVGLAGLLPGSSSGQDLPIIEGIDEMDFDRPEAWALKFFTSVSTLSGLGPTVARKAGSVELGFEVMSVPHLSAEDRTIGFNGLKEEDLNRSAAWARLRATIGLPAKFTLTLGYVPPVEVDGIEASLFSLGLGRPFWQGERGSVGWRLHGQLGDAKGDLTCGPREVGFPVASPDNLFGCEAVSNDEVTLEYYGAELNASYRLNALGGPTLHAAVSGQHMDLKFQVDAITFGFRDRTLLVTDGETWSAAAGATWPIKQRASLGVELYYTPLDVLRRGEQSTQNDALVNGRVLLSWRAF